MKTNDCLYHIYVNGSCIKNCLNKEDFDHEMQHIKAFLELTKLDESAKLEYEVVETSRKEFSEASY
jgi:hypothetical protein